MRVAVKYRHRLLRHRSHLTPSVPSSAARCLTSIMADDIVIDKALFHDRLTTFVTKWKADKRSGDHVFQGATAIATVVGKASEPGTYLKPAAYQLWLLGYEFPATLFILTPDLLQIVTTMKKGKTAIRPHPHVLFLAS